MELPGDTGIEEHKLVLGGNFEGTQSEASKSTVMSEAPGRQYCQQQIELCLLAQLPLHLRLV